MKDYIQEPALVTFLDSVQFLPKNLLSIMMRNRNETEVVLMPQLRLGAKALVCGAFMQEVSRTYGHAGSRYVELFLTKYMEQYTHARWLVNSNKAIALRLFDINEFDSGDVDGFELYITDAFVTLFSLDTVNGVFHRKIISTGLLF